VTQDGDLNGDPNGGDQPPIPAAPDDTIVPIPIVVIALYEFAKAAYLLFAFHAAWTQFKAPAAGPGSVDPLFIALPFFALVLIIAGWGLLMLRRWARHLFLFGGMLALPWLPNLPYRPPYIGSILDYGDLKPFLPRTVMLAIIVIDALVYVALMYYPDVAAAFREKGGDPFFNDD
jgi:hypothetical protein